MHSASKAFNLAGMRHAVAHIGPAWLRDRLLELAQSRAHEVEGQILDLRSQRSALRTDTLTQNSRLRLGSYISIELNTATAVPEWGGKKVFVMMEDDAYLTEQGYRFFRPRQERYFLIPASGRITP